jgi:hypothetical protein
MRVLTAIKLTLFGVALFTLAEYSMKDHDNFVYLFTWLGSIVLVALGFTALFRRSSNA